MTSALWYFWSSFDECFHFVWALPVSQSHPPLVVFFCGAQPTKGHVANWFGKKGPNGHIGGTALPSTDVPLGVRLTVPSPTVISQGVRSRDTGFAKSNFWMGSACFTGSWRSLSILSVQSWHWVWSCCCGLFSESNITIKCMLLVVQQKEKACMHVDYGRGEHWSLYCILVLTQGSRKMKFIGGAQSRTVWLYITTKLIYIF